MACVGDSDLRPGAVRFLAAVFAVLFSVAAVGSAAPAVAATTHPATASNCSSVMKADSGDVICRFGVGMDQYRSRILVAANDGSYGYYAYGPWRTVGSGWSTAHDNSPLSEHVIGITIQRR
jgi:hypothetical protein